MIETRRLKSCYFLTNNFKFCAVKKDYFYKPLTIFAKKIILDVQMGSEYASVRWTHKSRFNEEL